MIDLKYDADCDGKVAFDDRRIAEKAARRRPGQRTYKCMNCKKWHVGGHQRFATGKKFKRPSPVRLG
jgi:uncharacterized protein YlaI